MRTVIKGIDLVKKIEVYDEIEIPEGISIDERYAMGDEQWKRVAEELLRQAKPYIKTSSWVPKSGTNSIELTLYVVNPYEAEEEFES